jgi:hypothetical protein
VKTKALRKSKKMIQPKVECHHKNANDPQSSSQACYTNETRILEKFPTTSYWEIMRHQRE